MTVVEPGTASFLAWLCDEDHHCVVAEVDGRVVGVGLLHRHGEVRLCYLAPGTQRRGIGKAIYRALEARATSWGLEKLVLESTLSARPFYERLGYRAAGRPVPGFGISHCHPYEKVLTPYRPPGAGGHVERAARFLDRLRRWAADEVDVRALLLVGSFARGEARPDSDVDVVLLSRDPERFREETGWLAVFGEVKSVTREEYGRVTSHRVRYDGGLEVEFAIADAGWASVPLDPGTEAVARGGIAVLWDRDGHAAALASRDAA
jgi:GNAT superfamily N-acetyltransferase